MTLTTVILLILFGMILILAEIFFIPGATIGGILGALAVAGGVIAAFVYLDQATAWWVFGLTLAVTGVLSYLGFKTRTWERFEVKGKIASKSPGMDHKLQVGDKGITLSRCNPIGRAKFGDFIEEVYAKGDMLDADTPVEILRIENQHIFIRKSTES